MKLEMAALTHRGMVREKNEDSLFFNHEERLVIVCDGMGGHSGGNIASELGVQVISNAMRNLAVDNWDDEELVIESIKNAIFGANDHILARARMDPSLHDMGTTLVTCAFMDDKVITANVGDSRIYRIAQGQIEQVSEDHSLVQERIKAGTLDPNSDEARMLKNILTRALGMERITVDITVEELVAGDLYLLCSDGLSDTISDLEMLQLAENASSLQEACMSMIDLGNARGGPDNLTVALVLAQ